MTLKVFLSFNFMYGAVCNRDTNGAVPLAIICSQQGLTSWDNLRLSAFLSVCFSLSFQALLSH